MMDANNVHTVFGNWGVIGQPQEKGSRGAWPISTNGYIGDLSILIGAEVRYDSAYRSGQWVKTPNSIFHSVVTCPVNRPTLLTDTDPRTGKYWTFEPLAGYYNTNTENVAISNNKSSWPTTWPDKLQDPLDPGWPDSWNSIFGKGVYADLETYFVMDDNNDERFNNSENNALGVAFKPDSTNLSRNGLGLQVGVRYVQYTHQLLKDVLFLVYDIANKSTTNYSKLVFGNLMGTYVGVTNTEDFGEYNNDVSLLFRSDNLIVNQNYGEHPNNPYWQGRFGKCAQTFVETPYSNNRIASYYCFTPAGNFRMGDDDSLWSVLTPGRFVIPSFFKDTLNPQDGTDGDYILGSEYFSLAPGETKRFVTLLAYGYSENEIFHKTQIAQALWNTRFDFTNLHSSVSISNLSSHLTLSGVYRIYFSTQQSGGSFDIYFSPDAGRTWKRLGEYLPNMGFYHWILTNEPDCSFGKIRIYMRNATGKIYDYCDSPSYFTIDNSANGSPTIQILEQGLNKDSVFTQSTIDVQSLAADPEGQMLTLQKYYSTINNGPWTLFDANVIASDTVPTPVTVNLNDLPNSKTFRLKFTVADGVSSSSDSTLVFQKLTVRTTARESTIQHPAGLADTPYEIRIIDPGKTTGDTYRITFDDTSFSYKTFSVFNETKERLLINNAELVPFVESMQFDGLSLYAQDTTTHLDKVRTHWNTTRMNASQTSFIPTSLYDYMGTILCQGYALPADYTVTFFTSIVDTSIAVSYLYADASPINFLVYNFTFKRNVDVIVSSPYPSPFLPLDIFFLESSPGIFNMSWELYVDSIPRPGDSLYIYTKKGFSYLDTIRISGNPLSTEKNENLNPSGFTLNQNYPNPFNPTTEIQFCIPKALHVFLRIYNVLGQEVALLVDDKLSAGFYLYSWVPNNLSSGIYFYQLRAGTYVETKKAVFLK